MLLVSHELSAVADDVDRVDRAEADACCSTGLHRTWPPRGVGSLGVHAEDLPIWLEQLT